MFGWRKKRDGFEWRGYVRTTILVKRKKRLEKLDEAKQAALDGLAEAGRVGKAAGQAGVEAAKQGLGAAGREAKVAGAEVGGKVAAGAKVAGAKLGAGAKKAGAAARQGALKAGAGIWRFSKSAGQKIGQASGHGLSGLSDNLAKAGRSMSPRIGLPLVIAGLAAALGAITRIYQNGPDAIGLGAAALAFLLLAIAALPIAAGRASLAAPFSTRRYDPNAVVEGESPAPTNAIAGFAAIAAVVIAVALIGGLFWVAAPSVGRLATSVPTPFSPPEQIKGKAVSLSGDSMKIGDEIIVLAGIEAPESKQACKDNRGRSWRCGRSALNALRRITGYESIVCTVKETDASGRKVSDCMVGDKNIAAELVREGHVFATGGLLASYGSQEAEAQKSGAGIWKGEALRPSEYRDQLWEEAKAKAPNGCPIKGRVISRGKIYLLPWSSDYARYRVSERRGDRWFCSEDEAISEGWSRHES